MKAGSVDGPFDLEHGLVTSRFVVRLIAFSKIAVALHETRRPRGPAGDIADGDIADPMALAIGENGQGVVAMPAGLGEGGPHTLKTDFIVDARNGDDELPGAAPMEFDRRFFPGGLDFLQTMVGVEQAVFEGLAHDVTRCRSGWQNKPP